MNGCSANNLVRCWPLGVSLKDGELGRKISFQMSGKYRFDRQFHCSMCSCDERDFDHRNFTDFDFTERKSIEIVESHKVENDCRWGLEYADCIPCRVVRHPPKGVPKLWDQNASDDEAPVFDIWDCELPFHCHYSHVHSDP